MLRLYRHRLRHLCNYVPVEHVTWSRPQHVGLERGESEKVDLQCHVNSYRHRVPYMCRLWKLPRFYRASRAPNIRGPWSSCIMPYFLCHNRRTHSQAENLRPWRDKARGPPAQRPIRHLSYCIRQQSYYNHLLDQKTTLNSRWPRSLLD